MGETDPAIGCGSVKLCGSDLPSPKNSTGNHIFISFRSDGSVNKRGVFLEYESGRFISQFIILHICTKLKD